MLSPPPAAVEVGAGGLSGVTDPGDLTERLRGGSREAMAEVFHTHLDAIYNYCYRRTGSWSAAEDLASTVFLEVWRNRRRIVDVDGSALPWIYGVATNVCRNHHRTARRQTAAITRMHLADVSATSGPDDVDDQLDAGRRAAQALQRLDRLPQADQDVFVLVGWEGLSYAAAAEALAIPIGTVRSRLARVRRFLRLTDDQEATDV
jgi:RNA polymerase sigma factor (sigma-70 family)